MKYLHAMIRVHDLDATGRFLTDGLGLRTFHGRLLSSAIDSGVSVQPVAIRYLRDGKPCNVAPFIGDDDMLSHLLRLLDTPLQDREAGHV